MQQFVEGPGQGNYAYDDVCDKNMEDCNYSLHHSLYSQV